VGHVAYMMGKSGADRIWRQETVRKT